MARQKESYFSDRVKDDLDKLKKCWHFRLTAILVGLPDRLACINGHFVAIECKQGKNGMSRMQKHIREMIHKAGGIYITAHPNLWESQFAQLEGLNEGGASEREAKQILVGTTERAVEKEKQIRNQAEK